MQNSPKIIQLYQIIEALGQRPNGTLQKRLRNIIPNADTQVRAFRLISNPFSQLGPQLKLYSQLQLSIWSDPIAPGVPNSRYWVLVKIQGAGNLTETLMIKGCKFQHYFFLILEPSQKWNFEWVSQIVYDDRIGRQWTCV